MIALPKSILLILCQLLLIASASFSQETGYTRTDDALIIYPDTTISNGVRAVKLQVIADNIIRVTASAEKIFPQAKSLAVINTGAATPEWQLQQGDFKNAVVLKTKRIVAVINLETGRIVYGDPAKGMILAEQDGGRKLQPTILEGEKTYSIYQGFQTTSDDAWYGLGQHQDGLMNYKGYQVFLFQNNTEVAVPFLISRKNYGILWDNNSLTKAGDTRNYQELSQLKLFSKNNEAGWLTATYYNDRNKPGEILMQKAESDIKYEFLNDSKLNLPADFKPATGMIVWEGSLASGVTGTHKVRLTYGGYMKVWINGNQVLDRWRQSWNPGSAILDIAFEKDKKVPIKIEWIPDGGESYTSFKWLGPTGNKEQNSFGFSSEAGKLEDYYFIYGKNMDEVIGGYRTLTGKATLLPIWAFGFWQSRERYKTQDEILNTV
ncbi:MAG TPA: PA14 domain-containing protein, partial [Chitinophagaceae bacterium]|nr:PA14 domain-containing protein [Chitinophagaceae bacterium]